MHNTGKSTSVIWAYGLQLMGVWSALGQIDAWLETASAVLLAEGETYWPRLLDLLADGKISGAAVHDARIAALCLTHGVQALWTADRDFTRFPRLRTVNPLI